MTKTFVIFREGRRLCAAHAQLARLDGPILLNGRRFNPAGGLTHWNHITDPQKRLVGFVVQSLKDANPSTEWRAWWDSFDNRVLGDFFEAVIFLAEAVPADWHDDCALLVGGWVYGDGAGDFVLVVPDENGARFGPREPAEFWKELAFPLQNIRVE